MKILNLSAALAAAALAMAASASARADTVLLSLVDAPTQGYTSYDLAFVATGTSTTVSIGGYQLPDFENSTDNQLLFDDAGPNLLGAVWTFTPAANGSFTGTFDDGSSVPALQFAGVVEGDYDTYSQTVTTVIGGRYDVVLDYTNNVDDEPDENAPSGFLVTTTGAAAVAGGVPEPAAWAMMLVGFGGLGAVMRRRRTSASLAAA